MVLYNRILNYIISIKDLRRKIRDLQDELERLRSQINGLERTVRDRDEEIEVSNERI